MGLIEKPWALGVLELCDVSIFLLFRKEIKQYPQGVQGDQLILGKITPIWPHLDRNKRLHRDQRGTPALSSRDPSPWQGWAHEVALEWDLGFNTLRQRYLWSSSLSPTW